MTDKLKNLQATLSDVENELLRRRAGDLEARAGAFYDALAQVNKADSAVHVDLGCGEDEPEGDCD